MTFKEFLNEGVSIDKMIDALQDKIGDSKFDQELWDLLEPLAQEHGLYAGDATPDDIIDVLDDKQIKTIYNSLKKFM